MPGLDPGIHEIKSLSNIKFVDGRVTPAMAMIWAMGSRPTNQAL
jgi:hypothetical protein